MRYHEALAYSEEALKAAQNNAEVLTHKSIILLGLERCDEAIGCIDKALTLVPNNSLSKKIQELALECIKKQKMQNT